MDNITEVTQVTLTNGKIAFFENCAAQYQGSFVVLREADKETAFAAGSVHSIVRITDPAIIQKYVEMQNQQAARTGTDDRIKTE